MKLINDLFEVVSTTQGDDSYQCQVKFNLTIVFIRLIFLATL